MQLLWRGIKDSFYNPSFYRSLKGKPASGGIRFLFLVNAVVTVFFGALALGVALPSIYLFSQSDFIAEQYPDGLEVTVKDGVASVNQTVPYFIASHLEDEESPKHLMVIDTNEGLSIPTMKSYDTITVLTRDSLVFFKSKDETRIFSLKDMQDSVITEAKVLEWGRVAVYWAYILVVPLVFFGMVVGVALSLGFYLAVSFVNALITIVIGKLFGTILTYWDAYVVSLYAIVPTIVVGIVMMLFGFGSLHVIESLILFVAILIINFKGMAAQSMVGDVQ